MLTVPGIMQGMYPRSRSQGTSQNPVCHILQASLYQDRIFVFGSVCEFSFVYNLKWTDSYPKARELELQPLSQYVARCGVGQEHELPGEWPCEHQDWRKRKSQETVCMEGWADERNRAQAYCLTGKLGEEAGKITSLILFFRYLFIYILTVSGLSCSTQGLAC